MLDSMINISFQKDLLVQVDQIANDEDRTRAELIQEAVRLYIDRKKEFKKLFQIGKQIGETLDISEEDVVNEVKEYRKAKQCVK